MRDARDGVLQDMSVDSLCLRLNDVEKYVLL